MDHHRAVFQHPNICDSSKLLKINELNFGLGLCSDFGTDVADYNYLIISQLV
jgi:hypothetical protein